MLGPDDIDLTKTALTPKDQQVLDERLELEQSLAGRDELLSRRDTTVQQASGTAEAERFEHICLVAAEQAIEAYSQGCVSFEKVCDFSRTSGRSRLLGFEIEPKLAAEGTQGNWMRFRVQVKVNGEVNSFNPLDDLEQVAAASHDLYRGYVITMATQIPWLRQSLEKLFDSYGYQRTVYFSEDFSSPGSYLYTDSLTYALPTRGLNQA